MEVQSAMFSETRPASTVASVNDMTGDETHDGQAEAGSPELSAKTSPEQPAEGKKKVRGRPRKTMDEVSSKAPARLASNDACIMDLASPQHEAVHIHMTTVTRAVVLEKLWAEGSVTESSFRAMVGTHHRGESVGEAMAYLCGTMLTREGVVSAWVDVPGAEPVQALLTQQYLLTDIGRAKLIEGGFEPVLMTKWLRTEVEDVDTSAVGVV